VAVRGNVRLDTEVLQLDQGTRQTNWKQKPKGQYTQMAKRCQRAAIKSMHLGQKEIPVLVDKPVVLL
jgi:hypothetical protein